MANEVVVRFFVKIGFRENLQNSVSNNPPPVHKIKNMTILVRVHENYQHHQQYVWENNVDLLFRLTSPGL